MDLDISQEQFYARILCTNAAAQDHDNGATQTLCEVQSNWLWTY
jgi:hypothetical protein